MASGLLELKGEIDLSQFWPEGASDADTSKILVTTSASAFRYRADAGAPWRSTKAFQNAKVKGRITKAPIDPKRRVTVRLQGVDAPELHYRPRAALAKAEQTREQRELFLKWNFEFRQPWAETAIVELREFLEQFGQDPLPCVVRSYVDQPSDVFDTYARFVGDIHVATGGKERSINHWLVERGWAVPALYNSMSASEITAILGAASRAYAAGDGVWRHLADRATDFDWKLRYREKESSARPDDGTVVLPKLFRRVATWAVNRRAKMVTGSFASYLKSQDEPCFATQDFLAQGPAAAQRQLFEFVGADASIRVWPEDLVFRDAPSRLVGQGGASVDW